MVVHVIITVATDVVATDVVATDVVEIAHGVVTAHGATDVVVTGIQG
tara:strand:- start:221 stop:361 length:141 start_codon:yes stop_codon:yes gene_type:complete